MNERKVTHGTNQTGGKKLQVRFNNLYVCRLLMSTILNKTIIKKSEATANDAVIAFSPNAKRYLSKMFYPIFIIALMTVFTSCRDDENNISSMVEIKTMGGGTIVHDYSFAWNPNNPYDSTGYLHNEGLDYYALRSDRSTFTNLNDALGYIDDLTNPFFALHDMSYGTKYERINYLDTIFHQSAEDYSSITNYMASKYSTMLTEKLQEVLWVLSTHAEDHNITSICSEIKSIENGVAVSLLASMEKKIFFRTSAVAKFSSTYWIEVENGNGASDYWEEFPDDSDIPGSCYSCGPVTTAAVDAASAALGASSPVATLASVSFKAAYEYAQTNWWGSFLPDLP